MTTILPADFDSVIEAIHLLTDGVPSSGRLVDMDEVRHAIHAQDAPCYMHVNSIQIGGARRERRFLHGFAAGNHGESSER